jgi:ABC-type iron transport system FetAB ATPase subunit
MTLSSVAQRLHSPTWGEIFWAGDGIAELAQHSSRVAAFHLKIIHNEFGGTGRINKQLSYEYHNNII